MDYSEVVIAMGRYGTTIPILLIVSQPVWVELLVEDAGEVVYFITSTLHTLPLFHTAAYKPSCLLPPSLENCK